MSEEISTIPGRLADAEPASSVPLIEKTGREIKAGAVVAGAVFTSVLLTEQLDPQNRVLIMGGIGGIATLYSLESKAGRGIISNPYIEVAKNMLIGIGAAHVASNPDSLAPAVQAVETGVSEVANTLNSQGENLLKGVALAGGLAVGGWGAVKAMETSVNLAQKGVEKAKMTAKQASEHARMRLADLLTNAAQNIREGKKYADRDLSKIQEESESIDFSDPSLFQEPPVRIIRPVSIPIDTWAIRKN